MGVTGTGELGLADEVQDDCIPDDNEPRPAHGRNLLVLDKQGPEKLHRGGDELQHPHGGQAHPLHGCAEEKEGYPRDDARGG